MACVRIETQKGHLLGNKKHLSVQYTLKPWHDIFQLRWQHFSTQTTILSLYDIVRVGNLKHKKVTKKTPQEKKPNACLSSVRVYT